MTIAVALGPTRAYKQRDKHAHAWSRFNGVGYGTLLTPDTVLGYRRPQ